MVDNFLMDEAGLVIHSLVYDFSLVYNFVMEEVGLLIHSLVYDCTIVCLKKLAPRKYLT